MYTLSEHRVRNFDAFMNCVNVSSNLLKAGLQNHLTDMLGVFQERWLKRCIYFYFKTHFTFCMYFVGSKNQFCTYWPELGTILFLWIAIH